MTAMTPTQQPTDTTDPLNDPSGTTVASEEMLNVFYMTLSDRGRPSLYSQETVFYMMTLSDRGRPSLYSQET
jgi:hypothetical protein